MNCEGDTMTVSLSGVCYGSLHDSFCKEAPESLLSISRRLNLTIEGWGEEDYQEIQESIYYENCEVITDSTKQLIKEFIYPYKSSPNGFPFLKYKVRKTFGGK